MSHTLTQPRVNYREQTPELVNKLVDFSMAVAKSGAVDPRLLTLVDIRASQMNGCAFCLDMHVKEARLHGERELRLHHVAIWRESPLFSDQERAALALTEALTHLEPDGVSDELYAEARAQFEPKALATLIFRIIAINAWNCANVAVRTMPGILDKEFGLDKAGLS
jgi:AhpD family alkylhydroperoxidase